MKKRLVTLAGLFAMLAGYQNCARVSLEQPSVEEQIRFASGKMSLCLDDALANYTVENIGAYNLNLINQGKTVVLDTDGDGISDGDEARFGFNPLSRRSDGKHLDRVCLNVSATSACQNISVSCSRVPNKLGLSDCDIMALGLDRLYAHPDQGLDSDKDGMVDLLEVLRGTLPHQKDDLEDPDHDLVRNFEELQRGSNPTFHDHPFAARFEVLTSTRKLPGASGCAGEAWEFDVQRLPWVPATAVTDDLQASIPAWSFSFTRPKDTNTALITMKLRPRTGLPGNARIFYRHLILGAETANLNGTLLEFEEAGEVLP